jgi:hypothetical protein
MMIDDLFPEELRKAEALKVHAALSTLPTCLEIIFDTITRRGRDGITAGRLLEIFHKMPYSTVTTAPSKLLKMGLIFRNGDTEGATSGRRHLIIRVEERCNPQIMLPGEGMRRDDL